MRKYLTAIVAAMILSTVIRAQVYIQTTLPAVGLVQKNQLWNLVLINGTTGLMDGKLEMVLRDRQTGMELMTATTSQFSLPKGSLSVNVNNLNPIQYNYLGMEPGNMLSGLLPTGTYIACYSFTKITPDKQEKLTEECVSFDIEPLSPPMLIFPGDSSELEAMPAQFTWTPPTPAGMISRLQYEILITEIKPGQKADEAMQDNMSFYNSANVMYNFLTYPATLPAFEKEKWYGWQVVARDDKNYAGKSEVWVFKVSKPSGIKLLIEQTPFIKMKRDSPEKGIAPNGILKLSYNNETADTLATVRLTDAGSSEKQEISFRVKLVRGENLIQKDVKKLLRAQDGKIYEASIINSRNETWRMLFEVREYEDIKTEND
jgi:hypothetical protein